MLYKLFLGEVASLNMFSYFGLSNVHRKLILSLHATSAQWAAS